MLPMFWHLSSECCYLGVSGSSMHLHILVRSMRSLRKIHLLKAVSGARKIVQMRVQSLVIYVKIQYINMSVALFTTVHLKLFNEVRAEVSNAKWKINFGFEIYLRIYKFLSQDNRDGIRIKWRMLNNLLVFVCILVMFQNKDSHNSLGPSKFYCETEGSNPMISKS